SRRRHTRSKRDWSSDVCSSDLGSSFHSFVLLYTGEKFEKQAGTEDVINASEFSWEEQKAYEMADYLDEIGLTNEAAQIRETWMRSEERRVGKEWEGESGREEDE